MLLQSQLLCWGGVQVEGIAVNKGLVVEEPGRRFEKGYKEHQNKKKSPEFPFSA